MDSKNYLNLVLKGLTQNREHLSNFIYRESKKAELEFIYNDEFYNGLNNIIKSLETNIICQYNESVKEFSILRGLCNDDLEGQKPNKDDFSVHLQSLTQGQFLGQLYKNDLEYLKRSIIKAKLTVYKLEADRLINKIRFEKQSTTNVTQLTVNENCFLNIDKINKSHKQFNGYLFTEINFKDYLACFDLNASCSTINFLRGKKVQFIYFLSQIKDDALNPIVNDEIAKRFGISYYRQSKGNHKPNVKLLNQINLILR